MLQLYHELQQRQLWTLFDQLEAPLSVILALLELRGLHVNVDVMQRSRDTLQVTSTSRERTCLVFITHADGSSVARVFSGVFVCFFPHDISRTDAASSSLNVT